MTLVKKVDQLLADSWQIVEEKQKHVEAIKDEMIKETMLCTEFARRQHDKSRKQSKGEAGAAGGSTGYLPVTCIVRSI